MKIWVAKIIVKKQPLGFVTANINIKMNLFEQIREKVKEIPKGKVSTYGVIAKELDIKDIRKVGWALHQNKDSKNCPCHRVVNKEGKLSKEYVFGGEGIQKQILLSEGITFTDKGTVNLTKHLYNF